MAGQEARSWFNKATIYHVLIDRFTGDPDGPALAPEFLGGSIRGVSERLDHIQALGFDTLWLSPFFGTNVYHGYHVTDFEAVEPRFGTVEDLSKLLARAHARGMRVIADLVPNHCSRRHPFFVDATSNPDSRYRRWFVFRRYPDDYLCFLHFKELPKLNLKNQETADYIVEVALKWLKLGIDGYRIDHIVGMHHPFVERLAKTVRDRYPEAVLFGEAWLEGIRFSHLKTIEMPGKIALPLLRSPQEAAQRAYRGVIDGALDFVVQDLVTRCFARGSIALPELKRAVARHYERYPADFRMPVFLDNHDMNRFMFSCGNDADKLRRALGFLRTLGRPLVMYYGTEVGMTHDTPVVVNEPHSDLKVRLPMRWSNVSESLLFESIRAL